MQTSLIKRRVDELGRIVLPIEIRRTLDISEQDALTVSLVGEQIILRKAQERCVFCSSTENLVTYKDKSICTTCKNDLLTKL